MRANTLPPLQKMNHLNPYLKNLSIDYLYHLGLDTSMDLKKIFGDTKFVCMGGSAERAMTFAQKLMQEIGPRGGMQHFKHLEPIGKTERFSLYKVGPVISVSHGMGMPSISILLHEITKLMHYARVEDPIYMRIGTSGGIGLEPGTVVLTTEALTSKLKPTFELTVLGQTRHYPTLIDPKLNEQIFASRGDLNVVMGKTLGVDCFYEEQARLDGALETSYTEQQKFDFLNRLYNEGARNIEMEAPQMAAFCYRAGIRGAVICTTLLDRLKGDQVTSTKEQLAEYSDRAQRLVIEFIKKELS